MKPIIQQEQGNWHPVMEEITEILNKYAS